MVNSEQLGSRTTSNLKEEDDRDLMVRIAAGQISAFEDMYGRYRVLAYSIACRVTGDPSAAEEVVQDAFLAFWRNAAAYRSTRGPVRTWLTAIVQHRAIDLTRRRQRRLASELPEANEMQPRGTTAPDAWLTVASHLDADMIQAALLSLPVVRREALALAYFGGLTHREIAMRLGTPIGTVKSRIRIGLFDMRRAMEEAT